MQNKLKHRKQQLEYYYNVIKKNPIRMAKRRAYDKMRDKTRRKGKRNFGRNEIIKLLGGKCSNPYNIEHGSFLSDKRCLQIDHISGNGNRERKRFLSPYQYYQYILKQIKNGSKNYQLLCANCNVIKEVIK